MSFKEKYGDTEISGDFTILDKLVKELKKKFYVDVGILGSKIDDESGMTIAGIGLISEVGTDRAGRGNSTTIPKRSFIVDPIKKKQKDIQKKVQNRMQKHLEKGDVKSVFTDIGLACEASIQEAFDTQGFGAWADNAESTIKRKGSASPLIADGVLRRTITSKVGK